MRCARRASLRAEGETVAIGDMEMEWTDDHSETAVCSANLSVLVKPVKCKTAHFCIPCRHQRCAAQGWHCGGRDSRHRGHGNGVDR